MISKWGKIIFKSVAEELAPGITQYLEDQKAILTTMVQSWKCATGQCNSHKSRLLQLAMIQTPSVASVQAELLQPLEVGFPVQHTSFEEFLQSSPAHTSWMTAHLQSTPPEAEVELDEMIQALQQLHKIRFPNYSPSTRLTSKDILDLLETQDTVDMSRVEKVLGSRLSGTPEFSQVKQDIHGLKNDMSKAKRLTQASLTQLNVVKQMISFLKDRQADIECVLREGFGQRASVKTIFRDGVGGIVPAMWRVFKGMLQDVFNGLKNALKNAVASVKHTLDTGAISGHAFEKLIIGGIDDFSKALPAIKCFKRPIQRVLTSTVPKIDKYIAKLDNWFNHFATNIGEKLFNHVIVGTVNHVGKALLGAETYANIKATVTTTWVNIQTKISAQVNKQLWALYHAKPGRVKDLAVKTLKEVLTAKFDIKTLIPAAFQILQEEIRDWVSKQIGKVTPHLYDLVADLGSVVALPAGSIGINVAIGSGSCVSEWIGTGLTNIAQIALAYAQTLGRSAIQAVVDFIVTDLLNFAFKGLEKFVVTPLQTKIVEPLDQKTRALINALKKNVNKLIGWIPKGVLNYLKSLMKKMIISLLKAVAPVLYEEGKKNHQLARVVAGLDTFAPTMAPTGGPTMAPTGGPTFAPTQAPTGQPTPEPTWKSPWHKMVGHAVGPNWPHKGELVAAPPEKSSETIGEPTLSDAHIEEAVESMISW